MKTEWSLEEIYKGLEDPAYEADVKAAREAVEETAALLEKLEKEAEGERAERLLLQQEKVVSLLRKLFQYVSLRQSVDTGNGDLMAQLSRLQKIDADYTALQTTINRQLAGIRDIDGLAEKSELAAAYRFLLKENKEKAQYLLSGEVEEMIVSMNMTGGAAWEQLQGYLTSTVKVDYEGKNITLSEVRNLASSPDKEVRKKAYEAELAAYGKIQDSVAFSLNNIKNQVTLLAKKRGYISVLDMTLQQSRMKKETLDAMLKSIEEYLPVFRKYLRKKAVMLGYGNGLPWYELFAPLGKADRKFTAKEAGSYLIDCFSAFSPDMSGMIKRAFDEAWIDFYPRAGKRGGAFCSGIAYLGQSRIMTNFDGYFTSIGTLAHELGHAFHNMQVEKERILNQEYPMPVAETASTFNEVHLAEYALDKAVGDERLNLMENDLREHTQVILDIYSRYLFETAVFEQSQSRFLMAEDLNRLMLNAQKEAYGEGLDEAYLNFGMWICKPHYYSPDLSFYNFPYAFGSLFALGLYGRFKQEGEGFVGKYKKMLKATATCTAEEAGAMMGVDLTSQDFWRAGLKELEKRVERFCEFS